MKRNKYRRGGHDDDDDDDDAHCGVGDEDENNQCFGVVEDERWMDVCALTNRQKVTITVKLNDGGSCHVACFDAIFYVAI